MVKFGYGDVICAVCNEGIGIKTNIHRNSENWENKIHSGECKHFEFSINILTRKTFLPTKEQTKEKKVYFKGIDEIKQELKAKCKLCNTELKQASCCRNMGTGNAFVTKECKNCKNKVNFKYVYKTNYIPSYKENEASYLPNLTRIKYHVAR